MTTKKILYLTYDGLSDPLGSSQIIPYLLRLQRKGFHFTVVSFEKPARFQTSEKSISNQLEAAGIKWVPKHYRNDIPIISKIINLYEFKKAALDIAISQPFDLTLCRSYISAEVGMYLKTNLNLPFAFDTRGFWIDERLDKGIWNPKNPFYRLLIKRYRKIESRLYIEAKHIFTLTNNAKEIVLNNWLVPEEKVSVLTCATETERFTIADNSARRIAKMEFHIPPESFCLGYLGSLGGWYDLSSMMKFYKQLLAVYPESFFLFITPQPEEYILHIARSNNISTDKIRIKYLKKDQINEALNAFDLGIFFLNNCFSSCACSPTRLAELWAKGIPVVVNEGIGDLGYIFKPEITGSLVESPVSESFSFEKSFIDQFVKLDANRLRTYCIKLFNINDVVDTYVKGLNRDE